MRHPTRFQAWLSGGCGMRRERPPQPEQPATQPRPTLVDEYVCRFARVPKAYRARMHGGNGFAYVVEFSLRMASVQLATRGADIATIEERTLAQLESDGAQDAIDQLMFEALCERTSVRAEAQEHYE